MNNSLVKKFRNQIQLQLMTLPGILFLAIFSYIPMAGILIAFKDYNIGSGFFGSSWAGLKYFRDMFSDPMFMQSAGNTLILSLYNIVIGFPIPIILALILNEIPGRNLKKIIQTSAYLPYFISFVIVASMWITFLDPKGFVNDFLMMTGIIHEPIEFWTEPKYYRMLSTLVNVWKSAGYNAIIYLAAIAGINQEMYEAAYVDGAGRMRRIFNITLPNMSGVISIMFILGIGGLVRGSLDTSVLLGSPFNSSVSYVVEYYTLDMGLNLGRYSFATAVSLFQSVLSLILVFGTNWLTGKINGNKII